MDESFSTATTSSSSICGNGIGTAQKIAPPSSGSPTDNWTIEELLRWSLEKYRTSVISQTSSCIAALKTQCEKECDDVKKLHEVALELKRNDSNAAAAVADKEGSAPRSASAAASGVGRGEEENVNPQVDHVQKSTTTTKAMTAATTTTTTTMTTAAKNSTAVIGDTTAAQSTTSFTTNTINSNTVIRNITVPTASSASTTEPIGTNSIATIAVTFTSGPHASPTPYTLHPTLDTPCLIGRSKGKKFVKNGISLHKDQEVSTTHGKFMVEETTTSRTASTTTTTKNEMGSENGRALSFYYMDVGSTNGTTHNGTSLEPNTKLLLVNGMELKIGNSTLMIRLLGM